MHWKHFEDRDEWGRPVVADPHVTRSPPLAMPGGPVSRIECIMRGGWWLRRDDPHCLAYRANAREMVRLGTLGAVSKATVHIVIDVANAKTGIRLDFRVKTLRSSAVRSDQPRIKIYAMSVN